MRQSEHDPVTVGRCGVAGTGQAREEQHQGQDDAIVQPAFDVERLADTCRDHGACHHGLAEGGIGRRQDRRQQGSLPQAESEGKRQTGQSAYRDDQRHPEEQHSHRQVVVAAHHTQVDSGRVGEEHEDQRDLGQAVDKAMFEGEVGDPQNRAADDDAKGGENHRPRQQ